MFNPQLREKTGLENAIDDLLSQMDDLSGDSPEYAAMVEHLVKLHKMKTEDRPPRVSPDTLFAVLANLGGILILVGYEQKHVITSKALPFIRRLG